ncbi:unnamed protein product [Aureobasidium uvarum]|uniref:NADH dehydrogenase [ubiquinone] 1 beta subcomplex subunit 9 n=1 Tax=Aureobasidium uvarum TaxID=2773716 RepID=A0A9N8PPH8_9PEZI|nr:unnamed protein product [Aureobasidium uvarum]
MISMCPAVVISRKQARRYVRKALPTLSAPCRPSPTRAKRSATAAAASQRAKDIDWEVATGHLTRHTLRPAIRSSSHNGQHTRHVTALPIHRPCLCARADSPRHSRLYRRSLKLALDWSVHRYLWRGQAMYIRSLFEANANVREPRQQRVSSSRPTPRAGPLQCCRYHTLDTHWLTVLLSSSHQILFDQTEELLKQWKHPDPYRPPTAPGGSKYERNLPCPILERTSLLSHHLRPFQPLTNISAQPLRQAAKSRYHNQQFDTNSLLLFNNCFSSPKQSSPERLSCKPKHIHRRIAST